MKYILPILVAIFALGTTVSSQVSAQTLSSGTAYGVILDSEDPENGSIISATGDGYVLTTSPYDPKIFGVVSLQPAIYLNNKTLEGSTPIINSGQVLVRVSSANGTIEQGDFITSSDRAGVGQKALENGFVIGTAEEQYLNENPDASDLILVTLHPHFAQINNSLLRNAYQAATLGFEAAFTTPLGVLRYFIAGTITLLSFIFGFRFFAKTSNKGVEAIGRNPLAKQAILFSVMINTIITIVIMVLGVAISYMILVL